MTVRYRGIDWHKMRPKTEGRICAESIVCPVCKGILFRPDDGESRMNERFGRFVLQCAGECRGRWAVPVEGDAS